MAARILLAEDNESLAQVLKGFLVGQGFDAVTAKTGLEALQLIAGGGIDLLVLDLKLPVMSGVELLHKLRKSPPHSHAPDNHHNRRLPGLEILRVCPPAGGAPLPGETFYPELVPGCGEKSVGGEEGPTEPHAF